MTSDRFELDLAAGVRAFVAPAPTDIDAFALAHDIAGAHRRREAWRVFPSRLSSRYAWLAVAALLGAVLAFAAIGGRVVPPRPVVHGLIAVLRDGAVVLVDADRPEHDAITIKADRSFELGGWWPDRAWSPDGALLALTSEDVVYLLDPTSLDLTAVPAASGFPWRFNGWTPDGAAIVLHDAREGITRLVDLATGMTSDDVAPADRIGLLCSAALSPDGTTLAVEDQGGLLFVRSFAAGTWVRVDGAIRPPYGCSDSDAAYNTPDWAPDSKSLVYVGVDTLVVVQADGTGRHDIARRAGAEWSRPRWSPDGRWITFLRDDGLYLVRPDGTGEHRLVAGNVDPASIDWTPESSRIEFLRPTAPGSSHGLWWAVDVETGELSRINGATMDQGGDAFARQPPAR